MNASRRAGEADPLPHGEFIRSRSNAWIREFRAALQDADPGSGDIAVEGPHLVAEALRAAAEGRLEVRAVLFSEGFSERGGGDAGFLRKFPSLPASGISSTKILRTTDEIFDSISATETPQGIAALVRPRRYSLSEGLRGAKEGAAAALVLVLALVKVQDPGNVGTAVRSAEALGATAVIATKGTAHPWSQKALRASAGSALRMPMVTGIAPAELMTALKAEAKAGGLRICAACAKPPKPGAGVTLAESNLRGPVALLVGNEGAGLDASLLSGADEWISIPLAAPVESLNAGVAASLLLYEARRQRGR